jgi:AbiU2
MPPTIQISPKIQELFSVLDFEVTWLHAIWELYNQLYGTIDENYEIMNSSAPIFFFIIQNVLYDEFILILSRLTEKANTFGHENASFEQLVNLIDEGKYPDLVKSLRSKLNNITTTYKSFHIMRDKTVAHNDLLLSFSKGVNKLPEITILEAEAAIKDIADFMNEFSENVLDTTAVYEPFYTSYGDRIALIQALKRENDNP